MLSHDPRPRGRADADTTRTRIARRLQRYAPSVQAAVQETARGHPRVADLALSFPALLFALAVPRREADAARALDAAIEGRALADVAQAAGVPMWLRKLPVDALTRPLPQLPDGDLFRRRIANHLPRSPRLAPVWLETVAFAAQWAHEPFAIWLARELTHGAKDIKRDQLRLLCLWAWLSLNPGTVGHRMIDKPWQPALRFKTARDGAFAWHSRVGLHINLGEAPIADTWLTPGCMDNYEFVPLRTPDDIAAEAAAMKNCLNTYGYNLAHNRSRLWSVRMNGQRVATLRLAIQYPEPLVTIHELKGERNREVPVEVWWAARQWLHRHDVPAIDTKWHQWGIVPLDAAAWRSLWRPYWLAKRRLPRWLPLRPSRRALQTF